MPYYKDAKQGTWYVKLSYIDKFGDRQYKTKRGFTLRKDAKRFEDDFFAKLHEGEGTDYLSFTQLSTYYIEWYSDRLILSGIVIVVNHPALRR